MKRGRRRLLMAMGVALTLLACSDFDPAKGMFPLATGRMWIYHSATYNQAGTLLTSSDDTLLVLSDTVINGEHWYRTNRNPALSGVVGFGYMANRSDGLWYQERAAYDVTVQYSPPTLYFRYPASRGDTYMPDPTLFRLPLVVGSTNEACSAPSGPTLCVRYVSGNENSIDLILHVAPGIGVVLIEAPPYMEAPLPPEFPASFRMELIAVKP